MKVLIWIFCLIIYSMIDVLIKDSKVALNIAYIFFPYNLNERAITAGIIAGIISVSLIYVMWHSAKSLCKRWDNRKEQQKKVYKGQKAITDNYRITSEDVYFDSNVSSKEEKNKTHPDNLAMQYSPEIADKAIVHTTSVKAEPKTMVASQIICRKCGKVFSDETVFCPHCGKKLQKKKLSTSAKIIFWILGILLALGILFAVVVGIRYNNMVTSYNNALAAIEEGNFMIAQKYLQQIDNYEEILPEETAYINAAVLWEQGKNVEALKAFKKIRPEVPQSIIEDISDEIYRDAKAYYTNGSYVLAKNLFAEIPDYGRSNDFITLIKVRNSGSSGSVYLYGKLIDLINFQDAKEIILESEFYLELFLRGTWKAEGSSYIFEMNEDSQTNTTLPQKGSGKYYQFEDGIYKLGNDEKYTDCFKFTIIDKDTIKIYCYKNGKTYTMNKQ